MSRVSPCRILKVVDRVPTRIAFEDVLVSHFTSLTSTRHDRSVVDIKVVFGR